MSPTGTGDVELAGGPRGAVGRRLLIRPRSVRDWQADAEMSLSLRLAGEWDSSLSRIPDACVCTALRTLTRFVTRPMARWLAGFGITLTEFQILVTLDESPRSALALTCRLRLHAAPVSRALARLREREMVTQTSSRRFAPWSLTDPGRKHLEVLDLLWPEVDKAARAMLGEEFVQRVIALVDRLPKTLPPEHPRMVGLIRPDASQRARIVSRPSVPMIRKPAVCSSGSARPSNVTTRLNRGSRIASWNAGSRGKSQVSHGMCLPT